MELTFEFATQLWESTSEAAWVFASLPAADADELNEKIPERRGFGSIRVEASIGGTTWATSVFPDKSSGTYILPVKKSVRQEGRLNVGDEVTVKLRIAQ